MSNAIVATALTGLDRASSRAATAAAEIASGRIEAEPIVDLKRAEVEFKANAKVLAVAARMEDHLLDILA